MAQAGDRRKQRWLLGCIRGSPSWLCPTHQGVEGKLGATVLTTRSHVSHTQTATRRSGSTCPGKEHFPGQEPTWGKPQVLARAGQSCPGGGSELRGKGRIKKDGKRLKSWKKRESEGGKEGQSAGLAAQGPSSLECPVWRQLVNSQPTPDLSPPGAVQMSAGQETGAETQEWGS